MLTLCWATGVQTRAGHTQQHRCLPPEPSASCCVKLQETRATRRPEARHGQERQGPVGTPGLGAARAVALTCPVADAPGCGCVGASHGADLKGVEGPRTEALIGDVGDASEQRAVLHWVLHGAEGQQVALSRCLLPAG